MTYYNQSNPNHALVPHPRRHPVLHGIRIACIVLLTLLLVCTLTVTLGIAAVRCTITPEYVYRYTNNIDFAEFPLPTDDGFMTVNQLILHFLDGLGFPTTDADVGILFDEFSIPAILAGYTQDLVSWLLHGGTAPQLDPYDIAETALSGMDSSLLSLLYLISDPVEILGGILTGPLTRLNTNALFANLEPVQFLLSADMLAILISVCGILAVLLFFLCFCTTGQFLLPAGITLFFTGVSLAVSGGLLPVFIRRLTQVYAGYMQSFLQPVRDFLLDSALLCCLAGLIFLCIWLVRRLLGRFGSHPDASGENGGIAPRIPGETAEFFPSEEDFSPSSGDKP